MWHYIKYFFKMCFGVMIIIALNTILKKEDPFVGDLWFYITLLLYCVYCCIDYILTDKEN